MRINNQKGVAIYIIVIILAIVLASVLGLNTILIQQLKSARNINYSVMAFYTADTGAEQAIKKLNSADYRNFPIYNQNMQNGASYTAEAVCCLHGVSGCLFLNATDCPITKDGVAVETFSSGNPECAVILGKTIRFCVRVTGNFNGVRRTVELKVI